MVVRDHSLAVFSPALANAVTSADIWEFGDQQAFARLSPSVLFNEVVAVVLDPRCARPSNRCLPGWDWP